MSKFKVTATILNTMTVTKTLDANTLQEATIKLLKTTKEKDWKIKAELKTTSK